MSLHKLVPEAAVESARALPTGISIDHEEYSLARAILKRRALHAFDCAAGDFPIHRLVRCVVRGSIEDVFDDLALSTGLTPQRLASGSLLLVGPGLIADINGSAKAGYCSCTAEIWADGKSRAEDARATMLRIIGDRRMHRFLAIADGVIRAQGRKIIFTTNLPNVGALDDALLRPGRCFAAIHTRSLTPSEAMSLIARICGGDTERERLAISTALPTGTKSCSVASVYRACAK